MRYLKITFTTNEDKAGSILADLSGKVSSLDFEVVEEIPFHRNKRAHAPVVVPGLTPSRKGTTGKLSVLPGIFASELGTLASVTVQGIKTILAKHKMSPNSYTHAINVLKASGMIKATNDRGVYEVLK